MGQPVGKRTVALRPGWAFSLDLLDRLSLDFGFVPLETVPGKETVALRPGWAFCWERLDRSSLEWLGRSSFE
jgi:hypothetical protein